ncbi:MAG: sulfatase, partial [Phycisphaerae bacterium]
ARALCAAGREAKGLPVLVNELKGPHEWVRLSAAIVLDGIAEKARPASGALKAALKDRKNKYVVRVANHALNVLLGTEDKVR